MRKKISFLFLLFAISVITVSAQSTDTQQDQQEEVVWMPDKAIPVAEHFEGGQEAMYKAIYKELKYPPMAKRNRVQGDCIISFTLNEDGSTSGFKVLKNAGAGTGEEALRVVSLLNFNAPGYSMVVSLPVKFKL